tara:strand:+ start:494 stop:805 length:312 start_codon:yes stop_codon:yes gene_type:complete
MPTEDDQMQMQMLKTILTSQEKLTEEVRGIRESMIEIVRIEERQINQKEAITRLGRAVDKVEQDVVFLKTQTSTMATKVGAMASIAATGITGLVMYVFDAVTR